jgi:hypothetical protein
MYRTIRKQLSGRHGFVAVCVWLFSASWSYDLYLLLRNGYYPVTWWANLGASSLLYVSAGFFWNLAWSPTRGVIFSFMERDWPVVAAEPTFKRIYWSALLFMIVATAMIIAILWAGRR